MTPAPKRRWLRFSLRMLFVVVTVFACWLAWQVKIVRDRQEIVHWARRADSEEWSHTHTFAHADAAFTWEGTEPATSLDEAADGRPYSPERDSIPFWRGWIGDEAIKQLTLPEDAPEGMLERAKQLFPECDPMQIQPLATRD